MPIADYTPEVQDVGRLLRTRTRTPAGREAGTFNPESQIDTPTETRPTQENVTDLINQAIDKIEGSIGPDVPDGPDPDDPDSIRKLARHVTTLFSAMLVELTFFPEQVNSGRSPYPQLKDLFDEEYAQLINAIQAVGGSAIDPEGGADHPLPSFSFPDTSWMVGLGTRF